ncbi:MAG: cytidine deaminase [Ferruginibacter sp.]|nr:cytidine deaminase [Cytophagales bacterium]
MKLLDLKVCLEVYPDAAELPGADRTLLREAETATQLAYAPYSHFRVGAALQLADGTVVRGSNQENAAYPSGLCAERTALFWTGANHPGQPILRLAIAACSAHQPGHFLAAAPCGACRQALLEYENRQGQPIRVIVRGVGQHALVSPSIANLLPLQFNLPASK